MVATMNIKGLMRKLLGKEKSQYKKLKDDSEAKENPKCRKLEKNITIRKAATERSNAEMNAKYVLFIYK